MLDSPAILVTPADMRCPDGMADARVFRLMGALAGIEMALSVAGVPHAPNGVAAARDCLTKTSRERGVPS